MQTHCRRENVESASGFGRRFLECDKNRQKVCGKSENSTTPNAQQRARLRDA
jgi:hypothetical protein